eukprot:gene13324-14698_t
MYEDQITVLRKFFKGQNMYFSAPTGYGKSLIFQSIPMLADHLLDKPLFTSNILVVSPLKALMYDQVTYLTDTVCMNVVAITNESNADIVETIERGEKRIIYTSPESMLAIKKWRNILSHETFKENCIGVIFDEAHCISNWGYQTANSGPFRTWYRNVHELRLLLDSTVQNAGTKQLLSGSTLPWQKVLALAVTFAQLNVSVMIFDDIEADGNTEIQFSFWSEDEEMLPEWVEMRDDSYKIFPFKSGLLAEIDSVINTIDEPEISVSI